MATAPVKHNVPALTGNCSNEIAEIFSGIADNDIVVFPERHRFNVESGLKIEGKECTILGNGSTIYQEANGSAAVSRSDLGDQNRASVEVLNSKVHFVNLHVRGSAIKAGVNGYSTFSDNLWMGQHGFKISGSSVTLENCGVKNVNGDLLYFGKGNGIISHNVIVQGGCYATSGRQGITFTDCDGVTIRNIAVGDVMRSLFDFEPNGTNSVVENVKIEGIYAGDRRLEFVAARGRKPANHVSFDNIHNYGRPISMKVGPKVSGGTPQQTDWTLTNFFGVGPKRAGTVGFVDVQRLRIDDTLLNTQVNCTPQ